MYRMPHKCLVCGGDPIITQVTCPQCGSRLEGKFEGCQFCSLSPEESSFLMIFIKNRGNIKDVERELGVSYPTVRAALDNLVEALHLSSQVDTNPQGTTDNKTDDRSADESSSEAQTSDENSSSSDSRDLAKAKARKKILNLLAQHRITADEAAKQLQKC